MIVLTSLIVRLWVKIKRNQKQTKQMKQEYKEYKEMRIKYEI
jgi:hypothetical protein